MSYAFSRFGPLPMVMFPDEGGDGGAAGGGGAAADSGGDGGAPAGDGGQAAGGQGDPGAAGGKATGAADDDKGGSGAGDPGDTKAGSKAGEGSPEGDAGGKPAGDKAADKKAGAKAGEGDAGDEGDADKDKADQFPADWREKMAGDDQKKLNILKRYNSPQDVGKAYFDLVDKISRGELKRPLPKDASEEEIAEWRQENGIPEQPDGYLNDLPDGMVFGEEDMTVIKPFLEDMHGQNVPPQAVHSALQAYENAQAAQAEFIQDRDQRVVQETEDMLREEWGPDYRPNVQAMYNLIDGYFPEDVKDALFNARLGDEKGTPFMHDARVVQALSSMGRILSPQGTVTGAAGENAIGQIEDQIKAYEKQMGNKQSDYWKDPKKQEHYRELVRTREKMTAKG